ncbi:MAG: UDP-N-acetylmuramoyl-L-alanine--D-glutamate ligase [Candidatus Fermentibacteraceae bacterium]|nr:UDP-N-acetylmuramoyl-L-alanine--D-glutamate ligase [Candidatus Fermentibacteraceae bacterium]
MMGYWTDGDKTMGVLGLGRSGRAAAALLRLRGFTVLGLDSSPKVAECVDCSSVITGDEDILRALERLDGMVVSPGVDPVSAVPAAARELGIPVIGEIELAFQNSDIPVLAVTGSNGKTTTVEWLAYTLRKAGLDAVAAGNTGYPFSTAVIEKPDADWVSLEVSSYQLQTVETFRPEAAVILNITPDHLQRHGNLPEYVNAKARIFMNQHDDDILILNRDDPGSVPLSGRTSGIEWYFCTGKSVETGAWVKDGTIVLTGPYGDRPVIEAGRLSIPGAHNLSNALAVVCLAAKAGLEPDQMVEGLSTFRGVPHRIEWIMDLDGISFVNDSKSTNPDSLKVALESFTRPLVLIAGGLAKETDYGHLRSLISEHARAVVLIGKAAEMLSEAWSGTVPIWLEDDMERAVARAFGEAAPGDAVLLSPGCASFDQYANFEERGEHFRKLVEEMA